MRFLLSLLALILMMQPACARPITQNESGNARASAGQSATPKPAESNDPCSLITKEDAEEVLGPGVKVFNSGPMTGTGRKEHRCRYYTKTGLLDVVFASPVTRAEFEDTKSNVAKVGHKIQQLQGAGDESFIRAGDGSATLYIRKGEVGVWVDMLDKSKLPPASDPDKSSKAFSANLKMLAGKIANRLM